MCGTPYKDDGDEEVPQPTPIAKEAAQTEPALPPRPPMNKAVSLTTGGVVEAINMLESLCQEAADEDGKAAWLRAKLAQCRQNFTQKHPPAQEVDAESDKATKQELIKCENDRKNLERKKATLQKELENKEQ